MKTKEVIARTIEPVMGEEAWRVTDEEIVRCRDCEYATESIEGYWCDELCSEYTDEPVYVGDGNRFCAWGERRDD